MSLTPTDREEHFFKAMVDAADGSTPEELEPTERREHWYKEIIDAIKAGGGGSGGGVLEVTVDWDTANGTLNKTWQEIADAPMATFKEDGYTYFCVLAKQIGAQYGVIFASVNTSSMAWDSRYLFVASSADGYPAYTEQ